MRFQGQYFDSETGLHYNRHRDYSPDTGRLITADPIGLAGGLNSYRYTPNPVNWIDPLGLETEGGSPKKQSSAIRGKKRTLPKIKNLWVMYQKLDTGRNYEEVWKLNNKSIALDGRKAKYIVEAK
ncbi:hypothetical protein NFHSH190041_16940 [Shewanella sp. NFH-SH190041]|nr:hypothetical protein NFHSH190041_16940 [Shewanella sp. NFH-SH190041]